MTTQLTKTTVPSGSTAQPSQEDGSSRWLRSRRWVLITGVVVVVLALIATWLIAFSSVFGVSTVTVHGATELSSTQIRSAAGIADGTPLVRIDTADVTRRVEKLPDIASAQVSTSFPSTVTITVVERTPVGYVRSGGQDLLIDRTGARYRTVAKPAKGLPRFVLPSGSAQGSATAAVATVAGDLPSWLRAQVDSIQALNRNAITLVLRGQRLVYWGTAAQSAQKAQVLPVLLRHHTSVVDVTDPAQPFTR